MRIGIVLLFCIISLGGYAQEGHWWERLLGQVMTAEDMASEQWQENYDLLCELEQHPININKTTREELEQMPFLSTQQVEALMEYLYRYGSMKSMAELICHGPVPWQPGNYYSQGISGNSKYSPNKRYNIYDN